MSRVRIEFIGHIRTLAGEQNTVVELSGDDSSLGSALRETEDTHPGLKLFEEAGLIKGILVFRRSAAGGLERIDDLDRPAVERDTAEGEYVITTGMEGG